MNTRQHPAQVGAPDPELRNSPIIEETDEDYEVAGQALPGEAECHFNDQIYRDGQFVCSGNELLRCQRGAWVREGSCDPEHP